MRLFAHGRNWSHPLARVRSFAASCTSHKPTGTGMRRSLLSARLAEAGKETSRAIVVHTVGLSREIRYAGGSCGKSIVGATMGHLPSPDAVSIARRDNLGGFVA